VTATVRKRGRPTDEQLRRRRQETILDAAATHFAEHGYPGPDVQILAETLGLAKGTIYRYFPSKEQLFLAAVDRGMRRLRAEVDAAIVGVADPLERIGFAIRAYLTFFRDHPEYVELLIQERAAFRDRRRPTYFVHREANRGPWRDLYSQLIAAGRMRQMPVTRILDVLSDLVYGTMFTTYFAGQDRSPEQQAEDILDVVFHGILSEAERRQLRCPAAVREV
jgi:AcrR family transcriptional regulator